jgi:hypothetical protein
MATTAIAGYDAKLTWLWATVRKPVTEKGK